MITHLPYPNFACSAMVLDRHRLATQIQESRQILVATRNGGGWRNHPAVVMWRGHGTALMFYHDVMVREWARRHYAELQKEFSPALSDIVMPEWLGRGDIHASHRAVLLNKDPRYYEQFGWEEAPANVYVWPG